ncbi:hypothetical protein BKA69DRAFT_217742 [Paraphysoderma sedebokerense]|nr:hypothetical protein BKA69DRAFT_217742 [Paraphysoderma sedebokerense]
MEDDVVQIIDVDPCGTLCGIFAGKMFLACEQTDNRQQTMTKKKYNVIFFLVLCEKLLGIGCQWASGKARRLVAGCCDPPGFRGRVVLAKWCGKVCGPNVEDGGSTRYSLFLFLICTIHDLIMRVSACPPLPSATESLCGPEVYRQLCVREGRQVCVGILRSSGDTEFNLGACLYCWTTIWRFTLCLGRAKEARAQGHWQRKFMYEAQGRG